MREHFTTYRQGQHLLELGVDWQSADLHYYDFEPFHGNSIPLFGCAEPNEHMVPCWTDGALIDLLPEHIYVSDVLYELWITRSGCEYRSVMHCFPHTVTLISFDAQTYENPLYELVCWRYTLGDRIVVYKDSQESLENDGKRVPKTLEEYNQMHKYCPKCGGKYFSKTLAAYLFNTNSPSSYKNCNFVKCNDCGFEGIVHDLVEHPPKANQDENI